MAIISQQFRVVTCNQLLDGSGNVTATSLQLAPQPNGASTGALTCGPNSTFNVQLAGDHAVVPGTLYTLSVGYPAVSP